MTTFGKRVRIHRKTLGLTQEGLAKKIGLGQSAISQIESGSTAIPQGDTILALAKALQVSPDYLRTGKGVPTAISPTTEGEAKLLTIYRSLDAAGQAALMGAATGILHSQPNASTADPFKTAPRVTTKTEKV